MRTLNDLSQLKDSRFGQPWPRHGLRLLWWFADECVHIDKKGRLVAICNPANGAFGFHRFQNRIESDSGRLLPIIRNHQYYEVGNINNPHLLPPYVTENYTGYLDNSNTDRIIVSYDSTKNNMDRFDRIYVTQHSDQVHFDQNRTYQISPRLIKAIKRLSLEEFLQKTMDNQRYDPEAAVGPEYDSDDELLDSRALVSPIEEQQTPSLTPPAQPTRCSRKKCCAAMIGAAVLSITTGVLIYVLSYVIEV